MNTLRGFFGVFFVLLIVGCASGGQDTTETANTDGTSTTTDVSYRLNLENAEALLIQEQAVSSFLLGDTSNLFLSDQVSTNLWKMSVDGEIESVIEEVSSSDSSDDSSNEEGAITVDAERIDVAPTGEIYILLSESISIEGTDCTWVVINTDNESSCADEDTSFDLSFVNFDNAGNAFYTNANDEVRERNRTSFENTTLFDGSAINFSVSDCVPASDGSLILLGELEGTEKHLFRYYPEAIFGDSELEELFTNGGVSGVGNQFVLAIDDTIYFNSVGDFYHITISNGDLSYEELPSDIYGYEMAVDSIGTVYAVGNVRYNNRWNTVTVLSDSGYESIYMSLDESDIFEVHGDYMFASGTNDSDEKVFLRKHLLGDQEEIDLLNGRNMLVQGFDVDSNGDVFFGALDYDTVIRSLFHYHADTGELEEVEELPNDLETIIFL